MNLAAWMARAGRAYGDLPALAVGARTARSYAEAARRAAALAAGLRRRMGLAAGDRVAIVAKNSPEYVEALFAVWHAGLVAVPVNNKLHAGEVAYILEHSDSRLVFGSADLVATIAAANKQDVPVVAFGSRAFGSLIGEEMAPMHAAAPDDLAWLFYTSGTTGKPKGAMLSHRNLQAMSLAYFASIGRVRPGDAILHAAPMSHGSGLYILPHVAMAAANVVPESGGFDPAEIFTTIARWPGTSMFAAPTMVKRLIRHEAAVEPTNLKALIYGGGPMYIEDAQAALTRLGPRLVQIYGQGESPMTITCLDRETIADQSHPRWLERLGSVGLPFPNVEVRVGDAADDPCAVGDSGEVLVRGDPVMLGYWRNPEATAETLRNGWLHTGDVGALDEDGFLTLRERSKDLIISGGTNIYPREVEEVLLQHPKVEEVSVIGRRDAEWGEVVVACFVGEATPAELDALCLEKMARFKRPKDYVRMPALPKNNYGKILKTELRALDAKRHGTVE
jgi:long-chain acyl-CoA synthetase